MTEASARPEHVDDETLARHASGDLPADSAVEVAKHLAICDGDCPDGLRAHAASLQSTREALYVDAAATSGPKPETPESIPPETEPSSGVGRRTDTERPPAPPPPPPQLDEAARKVSERTHPGKSIRSFSCRDVLWEMYEQMARELECSVDYLMNEAMKHYARHRSYQARTPAPGAVSNPPPAARP